MIPFTKQRSLNCIKQRKVWLKADCLTLTTDLSFRKFKSLTNTLITLHKPWRFNKRWQIMSVDYGYA